jgi:hypothetical protein
LEEIHKAGDLPVNDDKEDYNKNGTYKNYVWLDFSEW